jgi:hypothetical protein
MEISTIKLTSLNLEIWRQNFKRREMSTFTLDGAAFLLEELGNGWRLPNILELTIMNNLMSIDIFATESSSEEDYWSSEEDPDNAMFCNMSFSFSDEEVYSREHKEYLNVRPVRTI